MISIVWDNFLSQITQINLKKMFPLLQITIQNYFVIIFVNFYNHYSSSLISKQRLNYNIFIIISLCYELFMIIHGGLLEN
jgi:hypothetical protein